MTATIAITGGLGYLGGRLACTLAATMPVRLLRRDDTRPRPAWAGGVEIATADLARPETLESAFSGAGTVVHLAAMNAAACANDPEAAWRVNVDGTRNVLAAARAAGVGRVVYLSTAHVYASPLAGHFCETDPTTNSHPYAATHRAAEDIVLAETGNVAFRLSNGVGAPMDTQADCWMLIANDLCRQAVEKGIMTLRGTGWDQRDFIPIREVCRAVAHVMALQQRTLGDGLFNLAAGRSLRTMDLARLVAERAAIILGRPPEVHHAADDGARPSGVTLSTDKLKATGFTVDAGLTAEIDATLNFCREAFAGA